MRVRAFLLAAVFTVSGVASVQAVADDKLIQAVKSTEISGRLVVHLGCGDGLR